MYSRMIFASFHQGKEERIVAFSFYLPFLTPRNVAERRHIVTRRKSSLTYLDFSNIQPKVNILRCSLVTASECEQVSIRSFSKEGIKSIFPLWKRGIKGDLVFLPSPRHYRICGW